MRRHFTNLLVGVEADLVGSVDGQQLIRVDGHQDGAGVRLNTDEGERTDVNAVYFRLKLLLDLRSEGFHAKDL